jgi:hypothetical protein
MPLLALDDERGLAVDTSDWHHRLRWQWDGPGQPARSQALSSYAESLHRARFVLCPRGSGLSSIRLFEAMRAGRCPVIIADDWMAPLFVDWQSCSVRVAEADIARLPAVLREREGEAGDLGRASREIWERWFAPATMLDTLVAACMDIQRSDIRSSARIAMAGRSAGSRAGVRKMKLAGQRFVERVRNPAGLEVTD